MQLEHAQDFAMPPTVPPTPETVRAHLETYHSKAERLLVWRVVSRTKRVPLLACGLKSTEDPASKVGQLVTARCQADENEQGTLCQYALQLELENLQKKNKPPRVTVQFWLGPEGETHEHAPDPMQWDAAIMGHVQACWSQINEQSQMIVKLGETCINRAADSFHRERQALEIVADARVEIEQQRQQGELEKAKLQQNDQLIELAKPAAKAIAEQAGAHFARSSADRKRDASSSEPAKTEVVASAPATAEEVFTPTATETERELEIESLRQHQPLAYVANVFGDTISSRAWFDIADVFSKRQLRMLRACCESTTDEDAVRHFGELSGGFKKGQREALEKLLDSDQVGMITQLWLASAATKRKGEDESTGSDPES